MSWRIAFRSAFDEWTEADVDTRTAMLNWFLSLGENGPPDNLKVADPTHGLFTGLRLLDIRSR